MRLADDTTITIAGEAVVLRPTLRAAIRLERRYGGFSKLASAIMDGSLSAASDVIGENYDHPMLANRIFDAGLDTLREPLLAYVMACAGIDPDDKPDSAQAGGKTVPFSEYLTGLYRIATGWLGWTPDTALDATPAEIQEAHKGRVDMLRAIFGDPATVVPESPLSLDDKFKMAFRARGAKAVPRKTA